MSTVLLQRLFITCLIGPHEPNFFEKDLILTTLTRYIIVNYTLLQLSIINNCTIVYFIVSQFFHSKSKLNSFRYCIIVFFPQYHSFSIKSFPLQNHSFSIVTQSYKAVYLFKTFIIVKGLHITVVFFHDKSKYYSFVILQCFFSFVNRSTRVFDTVPQFFSIVPLF